MTHFELDPHETLVILEAANIALKNKQMFEHIASEMDLSEADLQDVANKLDKQLNS